MKSKRPAKSKALEPAKPGLDGLLRELRKFITESRRQVLRAVDVVQVRTCWGVGRHIVEFEQGGAARAEYGAKLLPRRAENLTEEFGRGFDERNLRYMRLFFLAFPIWNALRSELSWTHYRRWCRASWSGIGSATPTRSSLTTSRVARGAGCRISWMRSRSRRMEQ